MVVLYLSPDIPTNRWEPAISDNLFTLTEVCKLLDKSSATLTRYARENWLSSVKAGEESHFPEDEVKRYLAFAQRLG